MTSLLASLPRPRRSEENAGAAVAAPVDGDLPSAVLALAESEADAVADRLHDGALQALVVARYAADAAVRGGDPVLARDAVQDALVALRRAVWLLRPRGEQGLRVALEQLAAQRAALGGAPLHVDVDAAAAAVEDALTPAAATAAYRLVQHAAGDRPLTVRLRRSGDGLRLSLDAADPDPAAELLRARAVGATLRVTPDGAWLHLPLDAPPNDPPVPHLLLTGSSPTPLTEEAP